VKEKVPEISKSSGIGGGQLDMLAGLGDDLGSAND
jgi:hypothetical protein